MVWWIRKAVATAVPVNNARQQSHGNVFTAAVESQTYRYREPRGE